ncbi:MAG: hypothetical protein K2I63_00005, partial [Helicobacter sp.]|nr:hypothetical protein [Helicobacter sp.]
MDRIYLDFNALEQDNISKAQTLDYLRNNFKTNIDWEGLNEGLKHLPQEQKEDIIYHALKNDQRWEAYPLEQQNPQESNLNLAHKDLNALQESSHKDTKVKGVLEGIQYLFDKKGRTKEAIKEEAFIQDFLQKGLRNRDSLSKEEKDTFLKLNENNLQLLFAKSKGEEEYTKAGDTFIQDALSKESQRQRMLQTLSYKDLNQEDKDRIKQETSLWGKIWNNDREEFLEWKKQNKYQDAPKEIKKSLSHLQNIHEHTSLANMGKSIIKGEVNKEVEQKYKDDLKNIANFYGYDEVALADSGEVYFIKDNTFYKANSGFLEGFWDILDANKFSIAGGITGSITGAKIAPKGTKIAGAIAGGALGSYLGAGADAMLSNQILNREQNFEEIHKHMLEEGILSVVGDGVILGLSKSANGIFKVLKTAKKATDVVMDNAAPLRVIKENITGTQNIQAAKDLALMSYTQEEKEQLLEFAKTIGGTPKMLHQTKGESAVDFI